MIKPPTDRWLTAIDGWEGWLVSANRPDSTRSLRRYQLTRLALAYPTRDPWSLVLDDLVAFLRQSKWGAETRRSYRAAIRSFYSWGVAANRLERSPAVYLPPVQPPVALPRPTPEPVLRLAVLRATERVRLMILISGESGLRRAELARLHTDDIAGDTLRVHGKGGRERYVPISETVQQLLDLVERGWVFPGQIDGHLSPAHVGKLLSRTLGAGWTGHTLRHRCASVAYAAQRDLRAVQQLLGHARIETTVRYTAVPDGALRACLAATRIDLPIAA
jgi:integrase